VGAGEASGCLVGDEHGGDGGVDPAALGLLAHGGGEEGAGAEGFGEDEGVAWMEAVFAPEGGGVGEAGAGEGEGGGGGFGGVTAEEVGAEAAEFGGDAAEELGEVFFGDGVGGERHEGGDQSAVRFGAHGEDVAHAVNGGDAAEEEGVGDEGAEVVGGLNHGETGRGEKDGGVIGGVEAGEDVGAIRWDGHDVAMGGAEPGEHAVEDGTADFAGAAEAAHGGRAFEIGRGAAGEGG
jgi:hypothetical protein